MSTVNTDPGKYLGVVYTTFPRALGCIFCTAVAPEWLLHIHTLSQLVRFPTECSTEGHNVETSELFSL